MGKSRAGKACGFIALGLTSMVTDGFVHNLGRNIQTVGTRVTPIGTYNERRTITMFTADKKPDDAFLEVAEEATKFQKAVGKLSGEAAKAIDYATIPVAAGLGFVLTPSQKMAINVLGGSLFSVAGSFGRGLVKEERQKAAPSVLAEVLSEKGVANVTADEIEKIRVSFELEGEDWDRVLIELYKRYLLAMMNQNDIKTSDPKDLIFLADTLKMEGECISQAHYEACSKMYSEMMLYSKEEMADAESAPGKKINKFVFYTDRVFEAKETEEAAIFEMSRIRKVLDLSKWELDRKTKFVANDFYAKALKQIPKKLDKVKPETLEKARATLGVSSRDMFEMHLDFYQGELKKVFVEKYEEDFENNAIQDEDVAYFQNLQAILQLNTEFTDELFAEIAGPIFQKYLDKMLAEGQASGVSQSVVYADLARISNNLRLTYEIRREEVRIYLVTTCKEKWEAARKAHFHKKFDEVDQIISEMIDFFLIVNEMAKQTFVTADFDRLYQEVFRSLLREKEEERRKQDLDLHKAYVKRQVGKKEDFTQEDEYAIGQLEVLLGVSSKVAQKEVLEMSEGMLKDKLYMHFYKNELTMENKIALGREASNMTPDELKKVMREVGKELYDYKLKEYKKTNEVLTMAQLEEIEHIGNWFELEEEDIEASHSVQFGEIYKKTILEAMGPAAVIEPESYKIFDALAERCRLSERAQKVLFNQVIRARAEPMVESILNAWDMTTLSREALAKKRGTDYGTDLIRAEGSLGIATEASIIPDVLTLVDFFDDNGVTEAVEVEVEDENGNKETQTQYKHKTNVRRLINDPKLAEEIYRSFVVQAYSDSSRDAKRMAEAQEKLPGIFGIKPEKVKEIKASMGQSIVDRFVINFFNDGKQNFDPNALMFLAQIQTQLRMTDKEFDELITASKVKFAKIKTEELFSGPKLSAAGCKALRQQMDAMMIDIDEKKVATIAQRRQMFAVELGAAIESKLSFDEIVELAQECQEGYKITEENAQSALETLMQKRFESISNVVLKNIEAQFNQRASDGIDKIVRYGLLCPTKLQHSYTPAQVQSVIDVYSNFLEKNNPEDAEDRLATLKTVLGV